VIGLLVWQLGGGGSDAPSASDSPEDVVENYLGVISSVDFSDTSGIAEDIKPFMCASAQEEIDATLEDPFGDMEGLMSEEELAELMDSVEVNVGYEIIGSSEDGDTAVVDVEVTGSMTMGEYGDIPLDDTISLDMVREDDKWLICDSEASIM
jgi:hypothetical protein